MLATNHVLQKRYRIVRQLGHGGMGAVYEAIDERFGEPIALKEILIELTDVANERQRDLVMKAFEREAKSLAKASHEVVPYVRDYFSELDRQFLVMELVEGKDLAETLEQSNCPFPLEDGLKWMDQLLDALDYLHNLTPPIIHRDIKPQNLKLNSRRKIKLLDFGIAKSVDNAASTITNQTFVGATLNYSPIEQILRVIDPTFREFIILKHQKEAEKVLNQNTDARCDIYALGATFYHLLTNQQPMDVVKRTLAIWEGKTDPLPNPSKFNSEISPSISDCLLKAMEVERDKRFSSAIEMQEAIQKAIAEEKRSEKSEDKILQVPEQENLRSDDEERELQERFLMQAKTESLLNEKQLAVETSNEISLDNQSVPTEKLYLPISVIQSAAPEIEPAKSSRSEISNTQPLGNILKPGFTGTSHSGEIAVNIKETIPEPTNFEEKDTDSKSTAKTFWILTIAAVSILTVSGIGGMFWLNGSNATNSDKPAENPVISTPTATATISPTVAPSVSPTASPTLSATPNNTNKNIEKQKPSALPTPNKTPTRNPVKTPPMQNSPKPKPEKRNMSDDCIYNGKCD